MKKKGYVFSALLMTATMLVFSACGAKSSDSAKGTATYAEAAPAVYEYAEEEVYDSAAGNYENGQAEEVQDTSRKLIKNVSMTVETEDIDELIGNLTNRINSYGGYIEYSFIDNGSPSNKYYSKSASMTVRIPAKHLDEFLGNVENVSNIISKNSNVQDITLQYVDSEARRASLQTEQQRLLELVEQAEDIEEIIYIEDRLSEVRYELESIERQIRSYDNQVDYSTVNLDINQVKEYTPVVEKTRMEELTEGFVDSVQDVYEGILDFFVGLIVAIPYIIIWGIVILIIVLIIKGIVKRNRKNKDKRLQQQYEMQAQAWAKAQGQQAAPQKAPQVAPAAAPAEAPKAPTATLSSETPKAEK